MLVVAAVAEAEAPRALKPCGLQLLQLQTLNSIHIHSLSLPSFLSFSLCFTFSLFCLYFCFGFGLDTLKNTRQLTFYLDPRDCSWQCESRSNHLFFFLSFYVLNNNITSEYSFIILVGVVRACLPSNCIVVAQEAKSCSKFFVNLF